MSDNNEDSSFLKNRSVRARRGTKMAQLIAGAAADDAANAATAAAAPVGGADDEFWAQSFFADAADDEHYSTESESADVVDADFFDDEDANDNDNEPTTEPDAAAADSAPKSRAYVDPRGRKKRRKVGANAPAPVDPMGPVDFSSLPVAWQSRLAELDTLTVRQLRGLAAKHGIEPAHTASRTHLTRALQHKYADDHAAGADLPEPAVAPIVAADVDAAPLERVVRGSTKERTEATRAEMLVREHERAHRTPRRRHHAGGAGAPAALTQEQRLLEAEETERRNQAELARLTALHDAMRLQRAATARRKRHLVGPIVRAVSGPGGATLSFTNPEAEPLFLRPPPPAPRRRAAAPPANVAAYQQQRRLEAAQRAADVQVKLDTLQRLMTASHERAQQQARRPLPPSLAAPVKVQL